MQCPPLKRDQAVAEAFHEVALAAVKIAGEVALDAHEREMKAAKKATEALGLRDLIDWLRAREHDYYGSFDCTVDIVDEVGEFARHRLLGPL
jgi:adenylate cyclase class IV